MCELFAMSACHPTTVRLSLEELARHGGGTGPHKDGWGIAFAQHGDAFVLREPGAANESAWLAFLQSHQLRSDVVVAHIRRATQGERMLRNAQPFTRELGGVVHLFAHNGMLPGIEDDARFALRRFRRIGDTDSEHAFCALLETIAPLWEHGRPSLEARLRAIAHFAAELRTLGPANFIYSDGDVVFAHGHRRRHDDGQIRSPGLFVLCRTCDAREDGVLKNGMSIGAGEAQHVALLASVRLSHEAWSPLQEGEVVVLRAEADVVVLVAHVGLARTVSLVEKMPGAFDLVLSGDTHERLFTPIVRGTTTIVEPGSFASFLGRVDVTVAAHGRPRFDWHLLPLRADRYEEAPEVARIVRDALAPYRARTNVEVARTTTSLERYGVVENSLDDLYVRALKERTGADVALSNGFRFGHPLAPGPITEGDLMRFFPVDGRIKVAKITGAQLRAFWESEIEHVFAHDPSRLFGGWLPRIAGAHVRFRADAPPGEHVTSIEVGGKPLDPAATYTIASCEREGDSDDTVCRMKGVRDPRTLEISAHQVFSDWLRAQKEVAAPTE